MRREDYVSEENGGQRDGTRMLIQISMKRDRGSTLSKIVKPGSSQGGAGDHIQKTKSVTSSGAGHGWVFASEMRKLEEALHPSGREGLVCKGEVSATILRDLQKFKDATFRRSRAKKV